MTSDDYIIKRATALGMVMGPKGIQSPVSLPEGLDLEGDNDLSREAARLKTLIMECRAGISAHGLMAKIAVMRPASIALSSLKERDDLAGVEGYAAVVMTDAAERLMQIAEQKIAKVARRLHAAPLGEAPKPEAPVIPPYWNAKVEGDKIELVPGTAEFHGNVFRYCTAAPEPSPVVDPTKEPGKGGLEVWVTFDIDFRVNGYSNTPPNSSDPAKWVHMVESPAPLVKGGVVETGKGGGQ